MCRIFLFLLCVQSLIASSIEIQKIDQIQSYADEETLFLFDIDNTIFEPVQTLGSDQWFSYQIDEYVDRGYPAQEALEAALGDWMAIQNITKVKLVEPSVSKLIGMFQEKKLPIMGLTMRGLGLATRTIEQLQSLGIDLSVSAPSEKECFFQNRGGVLFRDGILFTAGTHNGSAFFKYLDKTGATFKKIVFVTNKAQQLRQVEKACKRRKIPFVGLRYTYLDQKVQNLRKDLVQVQWESFGNLMSDEEARKILKEHTAYIGTDSNVP